MQRSESAVTGRAEGGATGAFYVAGKILRACIVQGGKIVQEKRLRRHEPLTLGRGLHNTFVVMEPALGESHTLLAPQAGGGYELILTEAMYGRIALDGQQPAVDIAVLKSQGRLQRQGSWYRLALTPEQRGTVVIGNTALLFQFVAPAAAPEQAEVAVAVPLRSHLWQRLDWPYTVALLLAFGVEVPLLLYLRTLPPRAEATLENIDERWAKLVVPDRKPAEKVAQQKKASDAAAAAQRKKQEAAAQKTPSDSGEAAQAQAERRAGIRKNIQNKGILAVLGSTGSGSGSAVADVFAEGGMGGGLDRAFEGIAGVEVATEGGRTARGSEGAGAAASIGGLATSGGGNVGLGNKEKVQVASVQAETPEVDGALDSEAIGRVVRSRMRVIQDCYERELKREPNLSGKIEIEFTIGEDGRVEEARVSNNQMGSTAVGECIVARILRWRFPKPQGGRVTVNFPFLFSPAG